MGLTKEERETIERGGRLIKILRLAKDPAMDEVALKLNSSLTWQEREEAERWFRAFRLGATKANLFKLAVKLNEVD
jgi:hypothetical protein